MTRLHPLVRMMGVTAVAVSLSACQSLAVATADQADYAARAVTRESPTALPPAAQGMTLVWADEFSGAELDGQRWRHRALGPRKDGVTTQESVSLVDGQLSLQVFERDGTYYAGMIGTQETYQFRYGYIEFRAKIQSERGFWSAAWLQSPHLNQPWPVEKAGAEIDVFEALVKYQGDVLVGTHWGGYGERHQKDQALIDATITNGEFHRFGLRWTKDSYQYFLNDELIWQTQKAISQVPQYIILSTEVGEWAGDIRQATLPDQVLFDYVRVYQPSADAP